MFQKLVFNCAGILNFELVCIAPVYAQALLRRSGAGCVEIPIFETRSVY
jgi:hypothetical protein